jgi:glycerol-3-phosphate dehydrogenase
VADIVIIGAGFQGCTMALAAVAHGLRPILLEREQPGAGASGNSFGIVHGGLRYLQSFDLPRWRRSRQAQNWFLDQYPAHVRPLRCVMPLYRGRLRSPTLFAAARKLEAAAERVTGVARGLPMPGAMSAQAAGDLPVVREGLLGCAYWYDGGLRSETALLQAMLTAARAGGARFMGRHEVERLIVREQAVRGVLVRDRESGASFAIDTSVVINCAGAWIGGLLGRTGGHAGRPSARVLAYNLVLDIPPPPEDVALAVSEEPGRGRSYFLRRREDGRVLAGTFYRPATSTAEPLVDEADIADALRRLAACLPDLPIQRDRLFAVTAGLLPDTDGQGRLLASRDQVLNAGLQGYRAVLGGKLTTAPLLSRDVARALWGEPPAQMMDLRCLAC